MKKVVKNGMCVFFMILSFVLVGCGKKNSTSTRINAVGTLEVAAEVLNNVSVTLPEGVTREVVSNIQHDFTQDSKQIGGIVIVNISDDLLDAPLNNSISISDLLSQQIMSEANPLDTVFMCSGGNDYAYMEIYTGGDNLRYVHYLFRGNTVLCYDVWFDLESVDMDATYEIIATVSSDDISAELNTSVF